jgi:AcrR family transcriptional regulator
LVSPLRIFQSIGLAAAVGVTTRTFFRHFADKRDVLFAGAEDLRSSLEAQIVQAPARLGPLDAIATALATFGTESVVPRRYLRQRQAVIAASPELTERELIKFDALANAFTNALRQRGIDDRIASLAGQAGVAVFRTASKRWIDADDGTDMAQLVHDVLKTFRAAVRA